MRNENLLLILFFFILMIIGVYALITVKSEGTKCQASPLEYGIKKISEKTNNDLTCSCSFSNNVYLPFIITKNGSFPLTVNPTEEKEYPPFNFSKLE